MAPGKVYDSNAAQWPKYTGYKTLNSESLEIRLLSLEPGAGPDCLRYDMRHAALRAGSVYSAVSYSWGAPVPFTALREIYIHGECVKIRPTLYSFLETMAAHGPRLGLWIDAICINQDDIAERNQQISIMGTIYKAAREVSVWLGIGDDDTNYAIDHIEDSSPQTHFDEQMFAVCVQKLFLCTYWTRRWVIQELALAKELNIVCGRRRTRWRNLLKKTGDAVLGTGNLAALSLARFKQVSSLDSRAGQLTLLELMEEFRDARCIDPRDKVFALRGIAEDGYHLLPD